MKRPRPHIPLSVRVAVAERQAHNCPRIPQQWWLFYHTHIRKMCGSKRLGYLLEQLFGGEDVQLDHDPALVNRKFNPRTGKYSPPANSPDHLAYRLKPEHLKKTTGRNPGASTTITSKGSDLWLSRKFRKLTGPKKVKRKILSRPFPKRQRGFA